MKNKLSLDIHCLLSHVFGVLLLIYAVICCSIVFHRLLFNDHVDHTESIRTLWLLLHIFFMGFLLLGVSQFLSYVTGQTDSWGWILRRGELVLYLAIFFTIVQAIWSFINMGAISSSRGCSLSAGSQQHIWNIIFGVTLVFVKILIMFGIAQSLRAMRPSCPKGLVGSD